MQANLKLLHLIKMLQKEVGDYQLRHFRKLPPGRGEEKEKKEFVSQIDITSEIKLKEKLTKLLPAAGFLGEETGRDGTTKEVYWVVDPIDGTTNYLSGMDQFSISIALVENDKPTLGCVYRPASSEYFSAIKGKGAWHQNKKLQNHEKISLKYSLIGTGFPYRSPQVQDNFFSCAKEVLNHSRGIRRFGSAALDICYVACGYLQGFWETNLQPYDVCGALVLLEETGCAYAAFNRDEYDFSQDESFITGLPLVYDELKKIVDRHYL